MTDPLRRCANGPFYFAAFVAAAIILSVIGGVVIWWVLQCP